MAQRDQFRALLAGCGLLLAAVTVPAQEASHVVWKRVEMALLRVDDSPPKNWQVFLAGKRKQLLLVQIGARFVMLDVGAKRVTELAPRTLRRMEDGTLQWDEAAADKAEPQPAKSGASSEPQPGRLPARQVLPSADWVMRDVGPMLRIRLRLTEEGRDFDIQIPIQPDLRQFY